MTTTLNSVTITTVDESYTFVHFWKNVVKYELNSAKEQAILYFAGDLHLNQVLISKANTSYDTFAELAAAILGFMDTDARAFKVYTALLNQELVSYTSGTLTLGHIYRVHTLEAGDDLENCGFVAVDTDFVAIETTPTAWTEGTEVVDITASAPVATVLENTLGNIVWTYTSSGIFVATLTGAFTENKTVHDPVYAVGEISSDVVTEDDITMTLSDDGLLVDTKFEVKVYS